MPSAFTPDDNGLNDKFRVRYPFSPGPFKMVICNCWWQKLFETTDITKGWDGSFKNEKQPAGAYTWSINFTGANGSERNGSGMVLLLR